MAKRAVIGIGNVLMGDDGVGPLLIERAEERFGHIVGVDLRDEGTIGFGLVHVLKDYDDVIIVDSGDIGKGPGEFGTFSPDDVMTSKVCQGFSLHESDLMKVLEASRVLGELPKRVIIFAIQPLSLDWREGVSPEIAERLDEYLLVLGQLLENHS